jgi:hypothetical protein
MAPKKDSPIVTIMHPNCCGLDVHKESISACLLTVSESGEGQFEIRTIPFMILFYHLCFSSRLRVFAC